MDWKAEHYIKQIHRTAYKKFECYVITKLLHDSDLKDFLPRTQYYVEKNDGEYALIDLFYPQFNIAIEIDEEYHENHRAADSLRQNQIEKEANCTFHRISVKQGDLNSQIHAVKIAILKEYHRQLNKGIFSQWEEPKTLDIIEAKKENSNTLFIKIIGPIPPGDLEKRQTSRWRISERKKLIIKQIVVVHDGMITRVTNKIKWRKMNGYSSYSGDLNKDSKLLGIIIQNWDTQNTITYSDDVR
ncbi:hypothetical protein N8629_01360 [Akkermansiaceae bacterium]|nr:hypothetical protein [Akkermansiaceae bacterium]MDB4706478.1 hypothetical protein [Akkermansiaceae bacterium]MDB4800294.1 hypothetical protein [Akkermansiaceae bacterium]